MNVKSLLALALAGLLGMAAACSRERAAHRLYHCPMHPNYISEQPGNCPICGMRLVPVEARKAGPGSHPEAPGQGADGLAAVEASAATLRLAGVQTATAIRATLTRTPRAVGIVVADETRVRQVHTKISGWVETLSVNATGQLVRAGQPLLSIYSPQLLATQEELVRAKDMATRFSASALPEVRRGGEDLLTAARRRLELFDVPKSLIEEVERTGKAQRTVTLRAPASGYVTAKDVFEGQEIQPGMSLFTLTDLSRIWVEADVYETEAADLRIGGRAVVSLPYADDRKVAGRVAFVYPTLDLGSRTLKVRLELANPGLLFKPGMYVDVRLELATSEGVVVPDSAVLDTGSRQVVFVATADGFAPREVRVGLRADGQASIVSGLAPGEDVAVKANFLLDSESRLRSALSAAGAPAAGGHQHGGTTQ